MNMCKGECVTTVYLNKIAKIEVVFRDLLMSNPLPQILSLYKEEKKCI